MIAAGRLRTAGVVGMLGIGTGPRNGPRSVAAVSAAVIASGSAKGDQRHRAAGKKKSRLNRPLEGIARVSAQQIFQKKMRAAVRAAMSCSTRTHDRRCRSSAHPYAAELYGVSSCERLAGIDRRAIAREPGLMTDIIHPEAAKLWAPYCNRVGPQPILQLPEAEGGAGGAPRVPPFPFSEVGVGGALV